VNWIQKDLGSNPRSSLTLVAHTCNPIYSGSRDQEDQDCKPAQANSSQDPITKNWASGLAQGEGPEFKLYYHKQNKILGAFLLTV
jgi:hypothetical protein